jgi:hypothetical protein
LVISLGRARFRELERFGAVAWKALQTAGGQAQERKGGVGIAACDVDNDTVGGGRVNPFAVVFEAGASAYGALGGNRG